MNYNDFEAMCNRALAIGKLKAIIWGKDHEADLYTDISHCGDYIALSGLDNNGEPVNNMFPAFYMGKSDDAINTAEGLLKVNFDAKQEEMDAEEIKVRAFKERKGFYMQLKKHLDNE